MRRAANQSLTAALVALAAAAHAQLSDVPPPPRLDRAVEAPRTPTITEPQPPGAVPLMEQLRAARPPNAARLAPLPTEPSDRPDEIVVIGQGWRLPDLGSAWRQQEAEDNPGRLGTTILPLYDPDAPQTRSDVYLRNNPEAARLGNIELFRVRFGRKPSED